MADYQADIGIETHVQLKTNSKLFCSCSNDARDKEPNTVVCPICMGLPGTLPVLNEGAVSLALRAGIALNGQVAKETKFDRKNYFYPDLPKGYQISQYDQPIVGKGAVEIPLGGKTFRVGITRAHLEEDAGKLLHEQDYSLVDLNRAGTPLLEIVSEPDMHSAAEAKAYIQEIYNIMRYAEVSDVDLYHGNMRFDVNVSVRKSGEELGTRSETKNLNSFRAVERATEYEIKRQTELLEKGEKVVQETRGWDEAKGRTSSQRGKEEAHDYRYFPEPDLPPLVITEKMLTEAKKAMPRLPSQIRSKLSEAGIEKSSIQTILIHKDVLEAVNTVIQQTSKAEILKIIINILVGTELGIRKSEEEKDHKTEWIGKIPSSGVLIKLAELQIAGEVSSTGAKSIYTIIRSGGKDEDPRAVAEKFQILQVSDITEIEKIVEQVIKDNHQAVEDYQKGNENSLQFLVGQVMKQSKGQANPQLARDMLKKTIGS